MPTTLDHTKKLLDAHTRRLEKLELEQATLGHDTPPQVAIEIEDIQAQRLKLEASIAALETVEDIQKATPIGSRMIDRRDESNQQLRLGIMVATVQATVAEVSSVKKYVSDEIGDIRSDIREIRVLIYRVVITLVVILTVFVVFSKLGWL